MDDMKITLFSSELGYIRAELFSTLYRRCHYQHRAVHHREYREPNTLLTD